MRGLVVLFVFLFVFWCGGPAANGLMLDKDLQKSAKDIFEGIMSKFPDSIPSPETFFQYAKNKIAGYPFHIAAKTINTFCSAALSKKAVSPRVSPAIANMSFVLKVDDKEVIVPLNDPASLWTKYEFHPKKDTVIFVTGWKTNLKIKYNDALDTMYRAYECRGNINFVAIDTAAFVDTLYSWSAFNTEEIGKLIANSLKELIKTYPIEKIHLIGHSLGAHIVGSAGRNFNYATDLLLPRITGLDPANPCFNEGEQLTGLSRGDAEFVDVIHSNPGVLGKRGSLGDADFYPNGLDPLPPGCLTIPCAHARAWEYMAESVYPGYENNFMAVKCGSLSALNSNYCPGKKYPMGYAVPTNLKGNFFLKTKNESPYGENSGSENPDCLGASVYMRPDTRT